MFHTILLIIGMLASHAFAQECMLDEDCEDGFYCNGSEYCDELLGECRHSGNPCNDGNDCTNDTCYTISPHCENTCNASSYDHECCGDPACHGHEECMIRGIINVKEAWANCGDIGIKIPICLENLNATVGGFQIDLCESIGDCLLCTECELTERTTMFDCVVNELDNGCCRVILFAKHPGGMINPGECNIVRIVYEISDDPECCNACIEVGGENIVVTDEYGYQLPSLIGNVGSVCPFQCGDVEPADDPDEPGWNCGDGDVDVFDFMELVDFSLKAKTPDLCQAVRADLPIGTPPICLAPDGVIDALDIMVINNMLLDRQDCCDYYYGGKIY